MNTNRVRRRIGGAQDWRAGVVAVATLALALSGMVSASAQGSQISDSTVPNVGEYAAADTLTGAAQQEYVLSLGFDEGLYLDFVGVAETRGVPLSEVIERMYGSVEFEQAAALIRDAYSDSVTAVRWVNGYGEVWVSTEDADAAARMAKVPSLRVIATDLPSEAEIEAMVADAASHLAELKLDSFMLEFSVDLGTYVVSVSDETTDAQLAAIRETLGGDAQIDRSLRAEPTAARGGMVYSTCTGGFVGRDTSLSVFNIITAQHCTSVPTTYDGHTTGASAPVTGRDLRWTPLSGTAPSFTKLVRTGTGSYQTVLGASNPTVGTVACKYGKTTGGGCDWVEASGICTTYSGWPQWCGMYRTEVDIVDPGDSGGPWFTNGATAKGITSGEGWNLFDGDFSLFTGIGSLSGTGVSVYY